MFDAMDRKPAMDLRLAARTLTLEDLELS